MITPEHYFSENPPERIIGIECEYNLQADEEFASHDYIADVHIRKAGLRNYGKYLSNGGGLYFDVGHLEYDTPECLGPRQAAAADMAGILVMRRIITASGMEHGGLYRLTGSYKPGDVAENNSGSVTSGYHENFQIPDDIRYDPLLDQLIPAHLATRLLAMNGMVRDGYVFSQKVWGIGGNPITRQLDRRTNHGYKPMAMIPPPGCDDTMGSDWARLEVRYADAGLSPDARYLSFAATSLVLRLVEHQNKFADDHKLHKLQFKNPVGAAYLFASDLTLKQTAETVDGRNLTAADTQEALAEAAHELGEMIELPPHEKRIPEIWATLYQRFRTCNPQQVDYGPLKGRFDIAAKHFYLANSTDPDHLVADNPDALQASLEWDKVLPEGGGSLWFKEHKPALVNETEIDKLVMEAPLTRAAQRANVILDPSDKIEGMSWTHTDTREKRLTDMSDAYAYQ